MHLLAASYVQYPSEWLHGRKKHEYPLERLPETMYLGIPLLEMDATVALGPVIPEDVTQARKNGITRCSSHCKSLSQRHAHIAKTSNMMKRIV